MSNEGRIWFNGELRESSECMVHVASHALHYGSSVFEGIRAYETPEGTMIFRGRDHLDRLRYSADVYRMPIPYTVEELHAACRETLRVMPKNMKAIDVAIMVSPWGAYLGEEGLRNGIRACITSWNRLAPNTMPPGVKAGGNYLSSQLIGFEARERGFEEGIGLGRDGLLSEGAGENIFVVSRNRIMTPPASASILSGITRDTVITLASTLDLPIFEMPISREQLYAADEIFMTGTAAEVTPVRQIDHIVVGNGGCGPLTRRLQDAFFGLFNGATPDRWGWLEPL
jgi:branched-chain amino acid aminotransferase